MIQNPHPPPPSPAWRITLAVALLLAGGILIALWPFLTAVAGVLLASTERNASLIGAALLLAIGVLVAAGVRAALAWSWRMDAHARAARVIRLPNDLPIDVADVRQAYIDLAAISMRDHYAAKIKEAEREHPNLTSYSQLIHVAHAPAQAGGSAAQIALPPPTPPTFAQLLDSGRIGPGRPLLLGFDATTGQPIEGSWRDLYSCGVGALQGAGKTWLLAFLLCQSAAQGGRLIVCDLHAGDEESLANRIPALAPAYMCDVAATPAAIASALAFAAEKLERRKGNTARWPIVLVCDEWTSLLRTPAGPSLLPHIQNIAEQGRKYNVNALLAAQAWTKAASSDVRNQLTSHYLLRQRPDEARYQLGLRADQLPDDIRSLPDATGYLLTVRGDLVKIVVPAMTAADIARVGTMIDSPHSAAGRPFGFPLPPTQPLTALSPATGDAATVRQQSGDRSATSPAPVATAAGRQKAISPEAARALALLHAGNDLPAIVKELRGVVPREGRRYMTALADVTDLIRQATQREESP